MSPAPDPRALLDVPRTPLVGRAADVAAITRWLEQGARVVTIAGPSGIGKTRVALEVARTSEAGVTAIVEVFDATADAALCDAVGRALGLAEEEGSGEPVTRIGRALAGLGEALVVLDGMDALAAGAAGTLGRWLQLAPELTLVIASRVRTHLPGEVVHELGPLPEAEQLFLACAQRIRAGWEPTPADREAVTAIVDELEGVPLALELAAARLSVMGARALLHRLRSGARGVGDALEHALESTWIALDDDERRALAMATLFRGGFTLEAAEAVLGTKRPVIDVVSGLRDKSLLVGRDDAAGAGEVRLDMYRALRAFAARKLDETAGAREAGEGLHAAYFAAFAGSVSAAREDDGQARLLAERENLLVLIERVARAGTVSARVAEPALRALLALAPLLFAYGPLRAYEVLVDPALAATRGSGADPSLVAEVLLVRGALHRHRGAAAKGARDLVHALGIARTLADRALEARALVELGHALEGAGDFPAAEDHLRRAAALHGAAGASREEGRVQAALAVLLARMGRVDEARELLARTSAREGDSAARADDLRSLGALELAAGNLAAAREATEGALAVATGAANRRGAAQAQMQLGLVEQRTGNRPRARVCFESASAGFAELGFEALASTAQGHLGVLAHEEGLVAEAVARLQAATGVLRELSLAPSATLFAEHLRALTAPSSIPPPPPDDALLVPLGGTWFRAPQSSRVGLERRRPLAKIVERLAVERLERPGSALDTRALQAAAWPGEKILPAAAAHRVRVAISTLRKLGLPLVTRDDGYLFEPTTLLVRA